MKTIKEPYEPSKEDYDNGIDHWAECEDPWNCNCEDFIECHTCNGYGFVIKGNFGDTQTCINIKCEEGLIHKNHLEL